MRVHPHLAQPTGKVFKGGGDEVDLVPKLAESGVAVRAEQAAHFAGFVVMINMKPVFASGGFANRTSPALAREDAFVSLDSNSVTSHQVGFEDTIRIAGGPSATASPMGGRVFLSRCRDRSDRADLAGVLKSVPIGASFIELADRFHDLAGRALFQSIWRIFSRVMKITVSRSLSMTFLAGLPRASVEGVERFSGTASRTDFFHVKDYDMVFG